MNTQIDINDSIAKQLFDRLETIEDDIEVVDLIIAYDKDMVGVVKTEDGTPAVLYNDNSTFAVHTTEDGGIITGFSYGWFIDKNRMN